MANNLDQLKKIIAKHYNVKPDSITEQTELNKLPGDDYDIIELIIEIEAQLQVKIANETATSFVTVGDINNAI